MYTSTLTKVKTSILFTCLLLFCLKIECKEGDQPPCNKGNFSLPSSQQPGPLISFGDNIIERNIVQLYVFGDCLNKRNSNYIDLIPSILYGITDEFSVFFNVPIAASYKEEKHHSSGFEDLFLQFEYAIFTKTTNCTSDQITVVANASFPTGSLHKNPPTGLGSMAYFAGTTYNHISSKWLYFTSYGITIPMPHRETNLANEYLYQFGLGRNSNLVKGWLFAWLVEIDGVFSPSNTIHGNTDSNSGGNSIYCTPSFWASSNNWILQIGAGYPIQQHLFGNQKKDQWSFSFNVGRSF